MLLDLLLQEKIDNNRYSIIILLWTLSLPKLINCIFLLLIIFFKQNNHYFNISLVKILIIKEGALNGL
jgi:hypothetical protein